MRSASAMVPPMPRATGQSERQGIVALGERSADCRGRRDSDIGHRVEPAQEAGEPRACQLVAETVKEKRLLRARSERIRRTIEIQSWEQKPERVRHKHQRR